MIKELLIREKYQERQIALLEDGKLAEYYTENPLRKSIVGNIYKAKIDKVMEGVSCCFVNIEKNEHAYLYVKEVIIPALRFSKGSLLKTAADGEKDRSRGISPLSLLKEGNYLIVQGKRDQFGRKHPKVSCKINLPGKNLIYLPFNHIIALSKKIRDDDARRRLKILGKKMKSHDGFIFRTSAQHADDSTLMQEVEQLKKIWFETTHKFLTQSSHGVLYQAPSIFFNLLDDLHSEQNLKSIKTNSIEIYKEIMLYCKYNFPGLTHKVNLSTEQDLFEVYGINTELSKVLHSQIWLKSGGYLVFNQTEALTSIDVNTGKFEGKKNSADSMLAINMESVKEACRQIRIRNISGIIIVDFIPMAIESQYNALFDALAREVKKDSAKIKISKNENSSLVTIVRKKLREPLTALFTTRCPYCKGYGYIKSAITVCREILDELNSKSKMHKVITVAGHPTIISTLSALYKSSIDSLQSQNNVIITLIANTKLHFTRYEIIV